MDELNYPNLIRQRLTDLAELIQQQHPSHATGIDIECVFDDERGQYLLVKIGWSGAKRVRGTTVYVRLRDGKFWIEEDLTEGGITPFLLNVGVPREDIVLAFQPPEVRKFTEYAVT